MQLMELINCDNACASAFIVVKIERSRVVHLNENLEWTEDRGDVAAWQVREDAYHEARIHRGLVVYVRNGELPPVSGQPCLF